MSLNKPETRGFLMLPPQVFCPSKVLFLLPRTAVLKMWAFHNPPIFSPGPHVLILSHQTFGHDSTEPTATMVTSDLRLPCQRAVSLSLLQPILLPLVVLQHLSPFPAYSSLKLSPVLASCTLCSPCFSWGLLSPTPSGYFTDLLPLPVPVIEILPPTLPLCSLFLPQYPSWGDLILARA